MSTLALSPAVEDLLAALLERARSILEHRFVGMYLYGSLATGDYVPNRSDLDFAVITERLLPDQCVKLLELMHRELLDERSGLAKKLEGAFIPRAVLQKDDPEGPPVPTINEERFYLAPLGPDWVIQRYIIRQHDPRLVGPPAVELIDPIGFSQVRRAIFRALEEWWEPMLADPSRLTRPGYQPFAVLSMCRALHAFREAELTSKEKAGRWAIGKRPGRWEPLITHAIHWRDGDEIASIEETLEFMQTIIYWSRQNL